MESFFEDFLLLNSVFFLNIEIIDLKIFGLKSKAYVNIAELKDI